MKWYKRDEFEIRDDVAPISALIWKWGIVNRTGGLRQYPDDLLKT